MTVSRHYVSVTSDHPKDLESARSEMRTLFKRAKHQAGLTNAQIAEQAFISEDPVKRLSSGAWVRTGLTKENLKAILVGVLGVSDETWREAERNYDFVKEQRPGGKRAGIAVAEGEPTVVERYGRSRSDEPSRLYPSIDRFDLKIWPNGRINGVIERIEPEGRRGALWGCAGREARDTILLTFWPLRSDQVDQPQADSAGHISVQRENSKRQPWVGHVIKMERHPSNDPVLHTYPYWLSPPDDPRLVSAASTIAVLDFDNTLARGWILGPWLAALADAGVGDALSAVVKLERLFAEYRARPGFGHDRLATEAARIYADSMKDVRAVDVEPLVGPFVSDYVGGGGQLFRNARVLLDGLRERGLRPVLVTGAPGELTEALMRELKVERCFSLLLEIENGVFTGGIVSNRGVSSEKAAACEWLTLHQDCEIVVAVGDSEGDRPLWREAQVAVRIGGDPDARDPEVDVEGVDLDREIDGKVWERIPTASWLSLVRQRRGSASRTVAEIREGANDR